MGEIDEWLDDFQMMGVKLNAGEKTLMRMAIRKENQRIMKVLEDLEKTTFPGDVWHINPFRYAIDIINQENK
jgi:hypothetical protein